MLSAVLSFQPPSYSLLLLSDLNVVPDLLHQHKFCVIKDHAHFDFVTLAYRGQYLDVNSVVPGSYCMSVPGPCNDLIPHIGTIGEAKIGSQTYDVPSKGFLEFLWTQRLKWKKIKELFETQPPCVYKEEKKRYD